MLAMKRRDAMVLGGFAALAAGWQWLGVGPERLVFAPLIGAPGWRFAALSGVSGASGADFATIGLEKGPAPLPTESLWSVVHRDAQPGKVPVAVFSDFFCPYCRGLISRLASRCEGRTLAITWHELPLLGANSVFAAQAAEAAALQGGYQAFYAELLKNGFRPTLRHMAEIGDLAGLDPDQLVKDMDGAEVATRLERSARAAASLGFSGTPGIAIGHSAILGTVPRDTLELLFDEEASL